jgi:hypothetical protein
VTNRYRVIPDHIVLDREAKREEIQRQVEVFLKSGGRIVEVPHGMSGIGGNGLISFRINNVDPQQRGNNGLFSTSTKVKKSVDK